jgi:hypothetical protein
LDHDFNQSDAFFNVSAHWYSDVFCLGKEKLSSQGFGVVVSISEPDDATFPADGLLGLSHFNRTIYRREPIAPIDNLVAPLITKFYALKLDKLGETKLISNHLLKI